MAQFVFPAGLLLIGAIGPALIAVATGVHELPRNDDWSYRFIADSWFRTGDLRLDEASQSFALGQILLTMPLLWMTGGGHSAFFVFGLLASIAAASAAFLLARVALSRTDAAIAVTSLLAAPGYLAYSHSYMTDVPAVAGQLMCLYLGVRALRAPRIHLGWAAAAIVVGVISYSIRQFALAAPIAVCIAALVVAPSKRSIALAAATAIGLISVTAMNAAVAGQVGAVPVLPDGLSRAASVVLSLSLFLLPVTLIALYRLRTAGSWMTVGAGLSALALVTLASWLSGAAPRTLGNLFSPSGAPASEYLVGGRPEILSLPAWIFVQVVALLATALLVDALARVIHSAARSSREPGSVIPPGLLLVGAFATVATGGLLVYSFAYVAFDRYLWPVIVPIGMVLLWPPLASPRRPTVSSRAPTVTTMSAAPAFAVSILGVLLILAVLYGLNSYAFDRARWAGGWRLVEAGYLPRQVDAGYEWIGTFAPDRARVYDRQVRPPLGFTWYGNIWPEYERCAIVAGTDAPRDGYQRLDVGLEGYRQFLIAGPHVPLLAFASIDPECRPAGDAT